VGTTVSLDSVEKKENSAPADNKTMITQLSNPQVNLIMPELDI
jgi:hypothetical protein